MKKKNFLFIKLGMEFDRNKKIYLTSGLLIFIGIILGSVRAVVSDNAIDESIHEYINNFITAFQIQGISKTEIFRLSLFNGIKLFIVLLFSGLSVWFIPIGGLQLVLSGFKLGFTVSYFIKCYSLKGGLLAFLLLMPQNIIFIPLICFFFVKRVRTAFKRKLYVKSSSFTAVERNLFAEGMVSSAVFIVLILICGVIEAYFTPIIMKMACSLFI